LLLVSFPVGYSVVTLRVWQFSIGYDHDLQVIQKKMVKYKQLVAVPSYGHIVCTKLNRKKLIIN